MQRPAHGVLPNNIQIGAYVANVSAPVQITHPTAGVLQDEDARQDQLGILRRKVTLGS